MHTMRPTMYTGSSIPACLYPAGAPRPQMGLADQQRLRPNPDPLPSDETLHVRAALRDQAARKDERRGLSRAFARSRTPSPEKKQADDSVAVVRVGRNGGISAGFVLPPSPPRDPPPSPLAEGPRLPKHKRSKHKKDKHASRKKSHKRRKRRSRSESSGSDNSDAAAKRKRRKGEER